MSEIRNCARGDIPAVAALFQKTFREPDQAAPAALEAYLAEAYLDHPWYDPEVAARVHVNDGGRVTGFIGVFPGRFAYRGKSVRAAIAGTLMVEHPEREPLAGAKLLRSVIKGPQDISLSETTNLISQALWERLGGSVVPLLSLDWFRVFRPSRGGAVDARGEASAASVLAPAGAARRCDRKRLDEAKSRRHPNRRSARGRGIAFRCGVCGRGPRTLSMIRASARQWSTEDLAWLLTHAAAKGALRPAASRDRARPQGRARRLLHLPWQARRHRPRVAGARPQRRRGGTSSIAFSAMPIKSGLAALRGRSTPQLIDALLTRNTIFLHRASMAIHPASGELADAIARGEALITGLAGESWTRLVGGAFG